MWEPSGGDSFSREYQYITFSSFLIAVERPQVIAVDINERRVGGWMQVSMNVDAGYISRVIDFTGGVTSGSPP